MSKPSVINLKVEITMEEKNWLKSYCQSLGLKYQWYLGQLVKDEIRRLKLAESKVKEN